MMATGSATSLDDEPQRAHVRAFVVRPDSCLVAPKGGGQTAPLCMLLHARATLARGCMVPDVRFELTRCLHRRILSPLRLPVPPIGRGACRDIVAQSNSGRLEVCAPRPAEKTGSGPPRKRMPGPVRNDCDYVSRYALLTEPNSSMSSLVRVTMASRPGLRSLRGS